MGVGIRSLNIWLALTHCGDDAPGLDVVARRLTELVPTGEGAFAWAASPTPPRRSRPAPWCAPCSTPATR